MMKFLSKFALKKICGVAFINEKESILSNEILPVNFELKIFESGHKSGFIKIDKKKTKKNICYAVFKNQVLVHETWIFKNKLITRQLNFKNAFTVGDCYTVESCRGKGIYTNILRKILFHFNEKKVVIYTTASNINSIRAIKNAGFTQKFSFEMIRFLGFKISLRLKYD